MRVFKVFILGLLYGLFLKVAIDRIYRDNELEDVRRENASLREYIGLMEAKLHEKSLRRMPAPAQFHQTETGRDDLKAIKGIGPVIERQLHDAGIFTFAALAALTVEELESILGTTRRLVKEGDLIAQAQKLAGQEA